jgi:hypothetical protein
MQRLEPIELHRDFEHAASKVIVVKNLKSNKRAISVKEREGKLDLKQSLPTTADSCNAKRPDLKNEPAKRPKIDAYDSYQQRAD